METILTIFQIPPSLTPIQGKQEKNDYIFAPQSTPIITRINK